MPNYYGSGRSNYVLVKDRKKFDAWIAGLNAFEVVEQEDRVGLLATTEDGDLPGWHHPNGPEEEEEELDFAAELAKHLVERDGNIFVWQSAGHEKMRYVSGWALAVDHKGDTTCVSLIDIYQLAKTELGHRPETQATY